MSDSPQRSHDTTGPTYESTTTRIIRELSEATGENIAELPPMYPPLDLEAIDRLMRSAGPGSEPEVTFVHKDVRVTVTPDEVRTEHL
jgi:hypothetical protein